MKKINIGAMISDVKIIGKHRLRGKYISYGEFAAYSIGGIGVNTVNSLFGYVAISANCSLIGSAYGIKPTHLAYLNIIMGILNLIKHLLSVCLLIIQIQNMGKFRPYLLYTGLPTAILLCGMAFIPNDINYWTKVSLIGIVYAFR